MALYDDDEYNVEGPSSSSSFSSSSSSSSLPSRNTKSMSRFSSILKNTETTNRGTGSSPFFPSRGGRSLASSSSQLTRFDVDNVSKRQLTETDKMINILSYANFEIEHHYIPFKYLQFFPIGCTSTHAFAIIKQHPDGTYCPIVLELDIDKMDLPHVALMEKRKFKSPWRKRLEGFDSYLGSSVYNEYLCVISHDAVTVMQADWKIMMRSFHHIFSEIGCCVMNHEFLCIYGSTTDAPSQLTLYVYRWCFSTKPIIEKKLSFSMTSMKLVTEKEDTLLFVNSGNNEGFTLIFQIKNNHEGELGRFVVLDHSTSDEETYTEFSLIDEKHIDEKYSEDEKGNWELVFRQKFILSSQQEDILYANAFNDGTVFQTTRTSVHAKTIRGGITSVIQLESTPIDAICYLPGIYVTHDMKNIVRFYNDELVEVSVAKSEMILEPMRILGQEIPLFDHFYNSLGICTDGKTIALLLTYGCLCVITPY